MFDWMDFRSGGKYEKENRVEKLVFLCLAMEGKQETGEVENPEEKFLSRAHKFFPPKSGGKAGGENYLSAVLR